MPAATLARTSFPARGSQVTLLTVPSFGRYAIAAASAQGTALQLVDRMAGPGAIAGIPGQRDGRIDTFLERGTYQLRLIADAHGTGEVTLSVAAFTELSSGPVRLVRNKPVVAALGDVQQRSWWLVVPARGTYDFEAGGRYLNDLRLWRDGLWMDGSTPLTAESDADPEQPLGLRQLVAQLEPGTYRLTAYGGPGLPWAGGATGQPFMLRWGIPRLAAAGRGTHQESLLGLDRYLVPGTATMLRLVTAQPAPAQISAQPYDDETIFDTGQAVSAAITKTSRDPVAPLPLPQADGNPPWLVTVAAAPGSTYRLEVFNAAGGTTAVGPGNGKVLLAVTLPGGADDEIDPGFLLVDGWDNKVLGASAIDLGTALPWRRRFNLLGPARTYLFASRPVDLRIDGAGARAQFVVDRFFAGDVPDNHRVPDPKPSGGVWRLSPGYYVLTVSPLPNGRGILTMSMTTAPATAPATAPTTPTGAAMQADRPRLPAALFADITLDPRYADTLYSSLNDDEPYGLRVEAMPAALQTPLTLDLAARQVLDLPVSMAEPSRLAVTDDNGGAIAFSIDGKPASGMADLAAGAHQLRIAGPAGGTATATIARTPLRLLAAAPLPPIASAATAPPVLPELLPDQPDFVDLARGQTITFALPVSHDALYRFETTGLLETGGAIRTRVIPSLQQEEGNGVGRNFLLQPFLRQGDYQLAVRAVGQTQGHAGVTISAAPVQDAGVLGLDQPARVTLRPGQAALYRFHVAAAGVYHIYTLGLGHQFAMRLEDGDGWPLIAPGGPADATLDLAPGDYRMILLPGTVENRAVTQWQQIIAPPVRAGHGPFAVTFGQTMANRWLEPAAGQSRAPDLWRFTLPAAATVTLAIDRGMLAELHAAGSPKVLAATANSWTGGLAAGDYTIAAVSAAPNSRIDYTIQVTTAELLPGQSRAVQAPATVPLSLGGGQQYEISSFGDQDVRAALIDAAGQVVAANDDRANDWNFLIAGSFPAGAYSLRVDPVGARNAATTVSVASPAVIAGPPPRLGMTTRLADGLVHLLPLPAVPPGALLLAGAAAAVPVGLALEATDDGQAWRTVAAASGALPYLAVPVDQHVQAYRLRAWPVDHGATPVDLTVIAASPAPASPAALAAGLDLQPVSLGGRRLGLRRIGIDQPAIFQLTGAAETLQWSGTGAPAGHDPSGTIVAAGTIWLVDASPHRITARRVDLNQETLRLTLAAGQALALPLPPAPGATGGSLWQALAQGGPPGIAVNNGSGAVAMAASADPGVFTAAVTYQPPAMAAPVLHLWQAGTPTDALPLTVRRIGFASPAAGTFTIGANDGTIPAGGALRASLPAGWKRFSLTLPAGLVAVLQSSGGASRLISGDGVSPDVMEDQAASLLLLNPAAAAAPFSVAINAIAGPELVLAPGGLLTRYSATPATLHIGVAAGPAMRLRIAGAATAITVVSRAGITSGGATAQASAGASAMVSVQPGLAIISEDGVAAGGAEAVTVRGPGSLALRGLAMLLTLPPGPARLVNLQTDAPVVLRDGITGIPRLFAAGAAVNLFQPNGRALDLQIEPAGSPALSGFARFAMTAAIPITDGLGAKVLAGPGQSRLFTFSLTQPRSIGVGVRGSVDDASSRLLASDGSDLGGGVVHMHELAPGTYYLAVEVPPGGVATVIQPALVGKTLPGDGPPPDVQASYLPAAAPP